LKKIEVVFHISSSWVKIRLHTENQIPGLPRTDLNVMTPWCGGVVVVVWWWWFFLTDNNTTPTKVVLSCFGLLVGLWQYLLLSHKNFANFEQEKCSVHHNWLEFCQKFPFVHSRSLIWGYTSRKFQQTCVS
jgi:hypothetical protein